MPATITLPQLEAKGACRSQLTLFKRKFGNQVEVTVSQALLVAQDFDWGWAADNLLTPPASKAFNEALAPASKAFNEALATALKAFNEALATALKAYIEALATARKAYIEALAPASKAFNEALATAFVTAYLNQ